jgi:mycoredoxin
MSEAIHFYWRPGCPFCSMLRRSLDKRGITTIDHDIWSDPNAAAVVRQFANGNETVPTVVIGDTGFVNPSAKTVEEYLAKHAPYLLPSHS